MGVTGLPRSLRRPRGRNQRLASTLCGEPNMPAWSGLISEAELEVYRRAGYQKKFGLGERPALLIIDVEYNFTGDVDEPILDSIAKSAASAFFGTSLVSFLIENRVDTVIHTGCVTSGCVRASVVDAASYGFKNAIVEECVFDRALTPHQANLFDMDAKYGDVISLADVKTYLRSLNGSDGQQADASSA